MKPGKTYSNTPDPTMLEDIGAGSYTVPEALAELAANSFDARVDETKIRIDVHLTPEKISILDNGQGMEEQALADAMILGVKMDLIRPRQNPRKGLYGLGMKTACASLGRHYRITTKDYRTGIISRLSVDLEEWSSHAGDKNFKWEITPEILDEEESGILQEMKSGTLIEVTKLKDRSPLQGPVSQKLGHTYKPHLQTGDLIFVNGSKVPIQEFKLEPNSRIEIEQKVLIPETDSEIQLTGWAGLDSKTHNDGVYGLNLYRNGQLIESWYKGWFRAHLMTSRVVGELHLDDLSTNFHKKGFDAQTPEWKIISAAMTIWLKPVVSASSNMNKNKKDPLKKEKAINGMRKAMGVAPLLPSPMSSLISDLELPEVEIDQKEAGGIILRENSILIGDENIKLAHSLQPMGEEDYLPWDFVYDEENLELQTVINEDSPIYMTVGDEEFFAALAMADTLMTFLVTEKSVSFSKARELRDRWLQETVANTVSRNV